MESSFDVGKISRLQENLANIRKVAGWSAEDLGEMLGVTRQTIVNLEYSNVQMSKTQYIAIRALLDVEIQRSNNETLSQVIEILIDSGTISEEVQNEVKKTISSTANSIGKRVGSVAIGTAITAALLPSLGILHLPTIATAVFLYEILKGKGDDESKK